MDDMIFVFIKFDYRFRDMNDKNLDWRLDVFIFGKFLKGEDLDLDFYDLL